MGLFGLVTRKEAETIAKIAASEALRSGPFLDFHFECMPVGRLGRIRATGEGIMCDMCGRKFDISLTPRERRRAVREKK